MNFSKLYMIVEYGELHTTLSLSFCLHKSVNNVIVSQSYVTSTANLWVGFCMDFTADLTLEVWKSPHVISGWVQSETWSTVDYVTRINFTFGFFWPRFLTMFWWRKIQCRFKKAIIMPDLSRLPFEGVFTMMCSSFWHHNNPLAVSRYLSSSSECMNIWWRLR